MVLSGERPFDINQPSSFDKMRTSRTAQTKFFSILTFSLHLFIALACVAFSACSTPARRGPASDTSVERFLATCGHAPLRMVAKNIKLQANEPSKWAGRAYFQGSRACAQTPCSRYTQDRGGSSAMAFFNRTSEQSYEADAVHLEISRAPEGTADFFVLDQMKTRDYSGDAESLALHPNDAGPDAIRITADIADRDMTLQEFMSATDSAFTFHFVDTVCPLTPSEISASCANDEAPFDPSEIELRLHSKYYLNSDEFKGVGGIGARMEERQSVAGFSYIAEYRDAHGRTIENSRVNHFTKNVYRVLKSMTRPACPKWKIARYALNAHNGEAPHQSFPVLVNAQWESWDTATLDVAAISDRSEEILRNYVDAAPLIFNLCYSLDLRNPSFKTIGNIFVQLDPKRNPIGSIRGQSGICTNFSKRADSATVPRWLGALVGADYTEGLRRWRNPRFP